jgi:Fic-DOC domain mobile mystery protein B
MGAGSRDSENEARALSVSRRHVPSDGLPDSTPLEQDEAEGLIPSHVATQGELNAWEQLNIARADAWAISRRRRRSGVILSAAFAEELHRRMFDETWTWAGTYRRSGKNVGIAAADVRTALRERLADAAVWLAEEVYTLDEIAARLHYQLVVVHPWPNGNGRWSRLMADALLHAERQPQFSWGGGELTRATNARSDYLAALRAADEGDFSPLLAFVRR